MAKMKVTIEFVCDIGDQTIEEVKAYLKQSNYGEVLEWMPDKGVEFKFEEAP